MHSTLEIVLALVIWTPTVLAVLAGVIVRIRERRPQPVVVVPRVEDLPTFNLANFVPASYNGAAFEPPRRRKPPRS